MRRKASLSGVIEPISQLFDIYPNLSLSQKSLGTVSSCYSKGFLGLPWFTPIENDSPEVTNVEVKSYASLVRQRYTSSSFKCAFDVLIIQRATR